MSLAAQMICKLQCTKASDQKPVSYLIYFGPSGPRSANLSVLDVLDVCNTATRTPVPATMLAVVFLFLFALRSTAARCLESGDETAINALFEEGEFHSRACRASRSELCSQHVLTADNRWAGDYGRAMSRQCPPPAVADSLHGAGPIPHDIRQAGRSRPSVAASDGRESKRSNTVSLSIPISIQLIQGRTASNAAERESRTWS